MHIYFDFSVSTRVIFANLDLLGPISLRTKIIVSEVDFDVYV